MQAMSVCETGPSSRHLQPYPLRHLDEALPPTSGQYAGAHTKVWAEEDLGLRTLKVCAASLFARQETLTARKLIVRRR